MWRDTQRTRHGAASGERPGRATPVHVTPDDWRLTGRPGDLDDVLDDSFPASDPPSWTTMRSGPPDTRPDA
jgi:hypothetical protein